MDPSRVETSDLFPIIPVDRDWAIDVEQLGAKRKFWYRPEGQDEGDKWLFKADERIAGKQTEMGTGEDWSEKIACQICAALGLPHVHYELAEETQTGVRGSVCRNFAASPNVLVLGNQLMLERDPAYPASEDGKYGVREHSVDAVVESVAKLAAPPMEYLERMPSGVTSSLGVFVGYVMLDALIANQDRHHQNWGALRDRATTRLAPTFDHGAGLARNEPDQTRHIRLYGQDRGFGIEAFATRARSSLYDGGTKPLTTLAAFEAISKRDPVASAAWLHRLKELHLTTIRSMIARVPEDRMTPIAREFTARLLQINQSRLLRG